MNKPELNIDIKSWKNWRRLTAEQLSSRIFYIVIAVSAVLFVLFRLVGYDIPYDENPDYNAPLLTGTLVGYMLVLVVATLALMVWGLLRSLKASSSENRVVNNVPARRIAVGVAAGFVCVLLLTLLLSDTTPVVVNGSQYTDSFWLRVSGMFVGTSILMTIAAVAAVVFGMTRNIRK